MDRFDERWPNWFELTDRLQYLSQQGQKAEAAVGTVTKTGHWKYLAGEGGIIMWGKFSWLT